MKKGFTLVELIATLVVISVVAIIVVPNIQANLNDMKSGIKITQIESIGDAAKIWAANNIDKLPKQTGHTTYVLLKDLQSTGYIDEDLYKDTDGNKYNDNLFVLIECEVVSADDNNNESYKYKYTIYNTNEKHLQYLASLYVKEHEITTRTTVSLVDLLPYANEQLVVSNKLKNIEDGTLISTAHVVITYSNETYNYSVTIS